MTNDDPGCGFQLLLRESDDRQAIYESHLALSTPVHAFHRYLIKEGTAQRIDTARQTACDLSISERVGRAITKAYEEQGALPEKVGREYW